MFGGLKLGSVADAMIEARKSPGYCSSRQGFLTIAAILSGKRTFLDKNGPPDEEGRL